MITYIMYLIGAEAGGSSVLQSAIQLIIPAIVSIAVVIVANRATTKGKKIDNKTDIYKVELDQLNKQREALAADNQNLRDDLKEELEDCRRLRAEMGIKMDKQEADAAEMKRKINTIEAELFAWRNGFKTIDGYALVKLSSEQVPPLVETEKKFPM